ncbi:MAG TPA: hypothetical protein PLM41_12890 [Saprospiraceae bacterium]|nr:hypothetical protein [Saprospiraceae bacterium]
MYKCSLLIGLLLICQNLCAQKKKYNNGIAFGAGIINLFSQNAARPDNYGLLLFAEISKDKHRWELGSRMNFIQSSRSKLRNPQDIVRQRNISIWQLDGTCRYILFRSNKLATLRVGTGLSMRHRSQTIPVDYRFEDGQLVFREDEYTNKIEMGMLFSWKSEIRLRRHLRLEQSIMYNLYNEGPRTMIVTLGLIKKF